MVTTNSHTLKMIEPCILSASRQCTLAARGIIDAGQNQPFYVLVSSFFDRETRLTSHVKMLIQRSLKALYTLLIRTVEKLSR